MMLIHKMAIANNIIISLYPSISWLKMLTLLKSKGSKIEYSLIHNLQYGPAHFIMYYPALPIPAWRKKEHFFLNSEMC
jgi:hypothetical protein